MQVRRRHTIFVLWGGIMITRGEITIYHITLNELTKLEEYTAYNYVNCWYFMNEDAVLNKGLTDANTIDVRIPYNSNENAQISHFAKGDIIYIGKGPTSITSQSELGENIYRITLVNDNNFGNNQHIHLGGK